MEHKDNAFSLPIRIDYQPPQALMYFMTFSYTGALLCLLPLAWPFWSKGVLISLLMANYIRFFRRFNRDKAVALRPQLFLNKDDEWSMLANDNNLLAVTLLPGAFVHRLLLVLRFIAEDGKSHAFILSPQNVEHNTLRRLRVRLLHSKQPASR